MASRDHDVVLVQGDDAEALPRRGTGGGERSFSYSYSRSSRGARQKRSPSPMSVGSSVIEEPKASNTKRRVPAGQSTLQASGQVAKRSKKKVRRRVAKVHVVEVQVANAANSPPPAPAPIKPPKTPVKTPAAKPPAMKLPAKTLPPKAKAPAVPMQHRVRKRRRTTNSPVPVKETPPVAPPRRTAAKSAPAPPPVLMVPPNVMDVDLTPAEQQELKDSVVKHVRQTVQADDEPDILAEFICVLLDQKKNSSEMLEELSVMDDEAQPFVTWLEKEKATLIGRRPSKTSWERRPPPQKVLADEEAPDKPPGQFTPLPSRSQALLTPNAVTASLEESAKAGGMDRQGLVVITNRLILQPNCGHGGHSGHSGHSVGHSGHTGHRPEGAVDAEKVALAEKKAEEAHQKKLDLLAEMTKELQVILQRLSDKNLADPSRERYQTMAQTIQNRMASLSRPAEKAERAYGQDLWQEKVATAQTASGGIPGIAGIPGAPGAPGAPTSAIVVSPASSS
ncbi:unnamed protein product [Cladocopium goreaui]|uniref:Uncharacterized protein n=1 Tax=Cladocopium goreaui TaxID=2562237 RepID=A0A9P1GSL4_9DINO|nr:unnamed protein product [Cladocopium goreaui]